MTNKTKFTINELEFTLVNRHVRTTDYQGNKYTNPVIYMSHAAAASVIKQYVSKRYPEVTCSVSSSSFSGGNSVHVYLSDERGNAPAPEIKTDVYDFAHQFVYGRFDGMTDMYEYNQKGDYITIEGYRIDASVKYITVSARAKHASVPDTYRMLTEMTSVNCPYIFGRLGMEAAIQQAKSFGATDKNIAKAIELINEDSLMVAE